MDFFSQVFKFALKQASSVLKALERFIDSMYKMKKQSQL